MKKTTKKTSVNSRRILPLMKSATVGAFGRSKPETADGPGKACVPPAPTRDWKPCHSVSHSPFFSHFPEEPRWFPAGNKSADLFPHTAHWSRTTGPAASSRRRLAGFISVNNVQTGLLPPRGPAHPLTCCGTSPSIGKQGRGEERTLFNRRSV